MDVDAGVQGRHIERISKGRREWHHRDWSGIDAQQQVEHRGIADDHQLVDAIATDPGALVQLGEDRVDRPEDGIAELRLRLVALHAVTDPRDDVRAEGRLAVER